MNFTIYKGLKPNGIWKIGCDQAYPNRPIQQNLTEYFILEEHSDIMIASKREIELQKEHNVAVDSWPYHMTKVYASKAAKKSLRNGTHNFQNGYGNKGCTSKEHQFNFSRAGGLAQKGKKKPHAIVLAKSLNKEWECPHCNKIGKGLGNFSRWGHKDGICVKQT